MHLGTPRLEVEVQTGKDTEPPLVFRVPSSLRKEGAGFLLWDTGAQRGWESPGLGEDSLGWGAGDHPLSPGWDSFLLGTSDPEP